MEWLHFFWHRWSSLRSVFQTWLVLVYIELTCFYSITSVFFLHPVTENVKHMLSTVRLRPTVRLFTEEEKPNHFLPEAKDANVVTPSGKHKDVEFTRWIFFSPCFNVFIKILVNLFRSINQLIISAPLHWLVENLMKQPCRTQWRFRGQTMWSRFIHLCIYYTLTVTLKIIWGTQI